jgi:alpha-glucuronidase
MDPERYAEMQRFLAIQAREARWWRDANLAYVQSFSRQPMPAGYEPLAHPFVFYLALRPARPEQAQV